MFLHHMSTQQFRRWGTKSTFFLYRIRNVCPTCTCITRFHTGEFPLLNTLPIQDNVTCIHVYIYVYIYIYNIYNVYNVVVHVHVYRMIIVLLV